MPACDSGSARLSGVWPPNWTNAPGGQPLPIGPGRRLGLDARERTLSGSSGSKYSRELASKSVETVSGFELIITACQPALAQLGGGLDGAVVELDPLPDPHRAAADDQRRRPLDRRQLRLGAAGGVRGVEVRRLGGELGRARVHHRVARHEAQLHARQPDLPRPVTPAIWRQLAVAEPLALGRGEQLGRLGVRRRRRSASPIARTSRSRAIARSNSERNQDVMPVTPRIVSAGMPRRSSARMRQNRESDGARKRFRTSGYAARSAWACASHSSPPPSMLTIGSADGGLHQVVERGAPAGVLGQPARARLLEAAERLVQRRAEGSVDRHDLAGRLHLAAQGSVGRGELVEREARQLDDHVVERRLERGDGRARDDVGDLGEALARRRSAPPRVRSDSPWPWTRAPSERLTRGLTSMTA